MRSSFAWSLVGLLLGAQFMVAGCGADAVVMSGASSPGSGGSGAAGQGGSSESVTVGVGAGGPVDCADPCEAGNVCSHGVCIPLTMCDGDNDCQYDTHCSASACAPWEGEIPPYDPDCSQQFADGVLQPTIQCEFSTPPMGDAFPDHVDVQTSPIVIHLSPDPNKPELPSSGPSRIIAPFTQTIANNYSEGRGVIRVLNGADCTLEANLGGVDVDGDNQVDWIVSSAALAAADIDLDGRPEIIAYGADGSTIAFGHDGNKWGFAWKAPLPPGVSWAACDANGSRCPKGWGGAAIHDLDDDGQPEIIREGVVFSNTGALLSGPPPNYQSYGSGLFSVLANLDQDPQIELTNGKQIWSYQGGVWVEDPSYAGTLGHVAVADFGAYGSGLPASNPEIAVVSGGNVYVRAATGEIVQGPVTLPGGGTGGPPTISDFDGDGLVELAVASKGAYTVFDIDCGANPRPGGQCPPGSCDFNGGTCPLDIAWSRESQDFSSSVTGSSIFDFEADGSAEAIYADECFVRVYEGSTGIVLFSQFRSSCTWYETPIVADVDGDYRAELVTPSNKACSPGGQGVACTMLNADGVDKLFNGLRCDKPGDCVSGNCDAGLCRCMSSAGCCAAADDMACEQQGYRCAAANSGTPGNGNTCRASHPGGVSGIRVYSDANDQWVTSRRIWNQHAYAVTHVHESGSVPKTSSWANNWDDAKLNNFRQNVPGEASGDASSDMTAGASKKVDCTSAGATMYVPVCNRGSLPVGPGVAAGFYLKTQLLCEGKTADTLKPGECEFVSCVWAGAPTSLEEAVDVTVFADEGDSVSECKEGNNIGGVFGVFCKPPA